MDELGCQRLPASEWLTANDDVMYWTATDGDGEKYALTLGQRVYWRNRNGSWIAIGYLA